MGWESYAGETPCAGGNPSAPQEPEYRCDRHHWPTYLPSKGKLRLFLHGVPAHPELWHGRIPRGPPFKSLMAHATTKPTIDKPNL